MIPLQLRLINFLSYKEATIDFRGIHTACICGANGAGKSSLLEAITWAIWGYSRAQTEDEVIHSGADSVRVDYEFSLNEQVYKIIRSRTRGKSSSLDFQIKAGNDFRTLSGRKVRDTQAQIVGSLKLDYDTFINSAYLRQGQADEFMKRSPGERKKILAELLKLNQYEALAEKAKDRAKEFKAQVQQLEDSLEPIRQRVSEKTSLREELKFKAREIEALQAILDEDIQQLQELTAKQSNRKTSEEQLSWQQDNYTQTLKEYDRLRREETQLMDNLAQLQALIDRQDTIVGDYQNYLSLQEQEEIFSQKLQLNGEAQEQKQKLENQLNQQATEYALQLRDQKNKLENLQQQEAQAQQTLSQAEKVRQDLEKLLTARRRREELDKLQEQVEPLIARRTRVEQGINNSLATLRANLQQQEEQKIKLDAKIAKIPGLRESALSIGKRIQELEKKQVYQKHIEEKGQEKKRSQEFLHYEKKNYETQLEELVKKLETFNLTESICPVCQQNLDANHRHHVISTNEQQQEEISNKIWDLETKINLGETQLQKIRDQYVEIKNELKEYENLKRQYNHYEAQLENCEDLEIELDSLEVAIKKNKNLLANGHYSEELQQELESINQKLTELNYDQQTHALVRSEENTFRAAEIKQDRINEAHKKLQSLQAEKPKILEKIEELEKRIKNLNTNSIIKQEIDRLEEKIKEIGYDRSQHQRVKVSLKEAQSALLVHEKLKQAQEKYPEEAVKREQLQGRMGENIDNQRQIQENIRQITQQINNLTDYSEDIKQKETSIKTKRLELDHILGQKGQLEEKLNQINNLEKAYEETEKKIKESGKKYRVYNELSLAFGKNGIQLHMIENVLPQLEAQTNLILGKLSSNQLHVQFVTQKAGKSGSAKKREAKLLDTLEININDANGTRAYETYSGGEAFRINFSIRLALAKLLAHRAGIALQMLIVDEGFGTQDAEGCDRLIGAINAIADDFSCILTVTHMPQFKEAFQNRIEVRKTGQGSKIVLLS
ncbi:MAG: Chromosome partition protein Smc [Chroococcopsis gigantea SAG 12.99]|jgi:exonuclease SbcC|nr:exonuclease subunit SbcC [Chlorogloea purpurea SAG 13.99]MDV3002270.1 Chromosome partition protein Smc [Chroococcopsis gigantea SAG 12.99]